MDQHGCDVRKVPTADMANEMKSALFHLHHAAVVLHFHAAAADRRAGS